MQESTTYQAILKEGRQEGLQEGKIGGERALASSGDEEVRRAGHGDGRRHRSDSGRRSARGPRPADHRRGREGLERPVTDRLIYDLSRAASGQTRLLASLAPKGPFRFPWGKRSRKRDRSGSRKRDRSDIGRGSGTVEEAGQVRYC